MRHILSMHLKFGYFELCTPITINGK